MKHKTQFPGVRYREHKTRKHGIQRDRYFFIRFQHQGKQREEGLGWASTGWTAKKAADELSRIREANRTGRGPRTLQEAREAADLEAAEEEKRRAEEDRLSTTVQAFWDRTYFPSCRAKKTQRTWAAEEWLFRLWISPVIGAKSLRDVCPFDMERIQRAMITAGKAPRSVEYALAVCRQIFNVAADRGMLTGANPAKKARAPKRDNRRQRYLTPSEAAALLGALDGDVHDMALLSLHCGLRAGEVLSLRWEHIDFDGGTILVMDTKGGVNRHVPMTRTAKRMLMARRQESGLVFPGRNGKRAEIPNAFARAVDALGLNDGVTDPRMRVCFHSLRHSFASLHAQRGESIWTIAGLLGHGTIKMSERYSHHSPDLLKGTATRLEDDLNVIPFEVKKGGKSK